MQVRSKKAAIENLEQALGHIWRSKAFNTSRIPKAAEVFGGSTAKISVLLQEVFDVYVIRPLYRNAVKMLRWYNNILKQYHLRIPDEVFEEGDLQYIWPHFQSGTAIFCVIYHLFGPVALGEGVTLTRVEPVRLVYSAETISEYRSNMSYVLSLLRALKVECLWDIDDWLTYPDTEFILLQLSFIYDALKSRQCILPPAQGNSAGVTSGPNGEPLVVGLVFSDSRPVTIGGAQRRRTAVLLGSGEDALAMLPIDTGGKTGRFVSSICPLGLMSNDVKIVRAAVDTKKLPARGAASRKDWNQSAVLKVHEEKLAGHAVVDMLKNRDLHLAKSRGELGLADGSQRNMTLVAFDQVSD